MNPLHLRPNEIVMSVHVRHNTIFARFNFAGLRAYPFYTKHYLSVTVNHVYVVISALAEPMANFVIFPQIHRYMHMWMRLLFNVIEGNTSVAKI